MTANQISYAAQQEAARHDQAVENETTRNNQAIEAINSEQLDWKKEMDSKLYSLQQDQFYWQKYIDEQNLLLKQADTDSQVQYREAISWAESMKAEADSNYKYWQSYYNGILAGVEQRKADEVARHNTVVEALNNQEFLLAQRKQDYFERQTETENWFRYDSELMAWAEQRRKDLLAQAEVIAKQEELKISYLNASSTRTSAEAAKTQANAAVTSAEAAKKQAETNASESQSRKYANYVNATTNAVEGAVQVLKPLINEKVGKVLSSSDAAKLAFESLFD